jgi:hypothetical protein
MAMGTTVVVSLCVRNTGLTGAKTADRLTEDLKDMPVAAGANATVRVIIAETILKVDSEVDCMSSYLRIRS